VAVGISKKNGVLETDRAYNGVGIDCGSII